MDLSLNLRVVDGPSLAKVCVFIACSMFLSGNLYATDYFVAQKALGASDKNDGSEALPWLTLSKATKTAKAGDVVTVKAGIYMDIPSKSNVPGGYNPTFSGTNGNPIVYKSSPPYAAIILAQPRNTATFARDPAWILKDKSYITIDGFKIRGQLRARDGDGIIFKNNEVLEGAATGAGDQSLFWGIEFEGISDGLIQNNYVHGLFDNQNNSHNSAGIMLLAGGVGRESERNIIEFNTVNVTGSSVYSAFGSKGGPLNGNIWRFNTAIGGTAGFFIISSTDNTLRPTGHKIHNNVMINNQYAYEVDNYVFEGQAFNNTAYNVGSFMHAGRASVNNQKIWNNVVVANGGRGALIDWAGYADDKGPLPVFPVASFNVLMSKSDNNMVSGSSSHFAYKEATQTGIFDLAEWQGSTALDVSTQTIAPGFVNPGGLTAADYKRPGANNDGEGGVVRGAYANGDEIIGFTRAGALALPGIPK